MKLTVLVDIFVRHFCPLATYITGARSFIANRIHLSGPVPASLHHRYVGFAPFIKAMFKAKGIKGILLNRTLHKQHRTIYRWDANTIWGVIGEEDKTEPGSEGKEPSKEVKQEVGSKEEGKPDEAVARKFLDMTSYGKEGRIFTYVILLDGEWRFTVRAFPLYPLGSPEMTGCALLHRKQERSSRSKC